MHNQKLSKPPGISPGTLIYTGTQKDNNTNIDLIEYKKEYHNKIKNASFEEIKNSINTDNITWINYTGLKNIKLLEEMGDILGIDKLVLEDILNVKQRPKVEFLEEGYLFVVLRMYYYKGSKLNNEQISIIIKDNLLVTFQEKEGDIFNPIRERIKNPYSNHRQKGSDYLLYTILDLIIDYYLEVIENSWDKIENIDRELIKNKMSKDVMKHIHEIKDENSYIRKKILPVRESINMLVKSDVHIIHHETKKYYRDLYDHSALLYDNLENQSDTLSNLISLYHSQMNTRMGETMNVLTVIATIFIPLTFITGLYGMNFKYMPELYWEHGYYFILSLMFFMGAVMLIMFKRMKWI